MLDNPSADIDCSERAYLCFFSRSFSPTGLVGAWQAGYMNIQTSAWTSVSTIEQRLMSPSEAILEAGLT